MEISHQNKNHTGMMLLRSHTQRPPNLIPKTQSQSYHTTTPQTFRLRLKKNFYVPRETWISNKANTWRNKIYFDWTREHDFASIYKSIVPVNHPLGKPGWQKRKIVFERDRLAVLYYRLYPEELKLPRVAPGDRRWYSTPLERFLERFDELASEGIPKKEAWEICKREKVWEKEHKKIELHICKRQVKELYNIPDRPPMGVIDQSIQVSDPRVVEYEHLQLRNFLDKMVEVSKSAPTLVPYTLKDANCTQAQLMQYLSEKPENAPFFDETVYFEHMIPYRRRLLLQKPLEGKSLENNIDKLDDIMSEWAKSILSTCFSEKISKSAFENSNTIPPGSLPDKLRQMMLAEYIKSVEKDLQDLSDEFTETVVRKSDTEGLLFLDDTWS